MFLFGIDNYFIAFERKILQKDYLESVKVGLRWKEKEGD